MVSVGSDSKVEDHPELAPSLLLPNSGVGLRGGLVMGGALGAEVTGALSTDGPALEFGLGEELCS